MPTENRSSNTEMVSDMLPPCADDVFKNGVSVCLVGDVPKHAAETICQSLSAITGWKIDWHYIGGRTHIKALAPAQQHQDEPEVLFLKSGYLYHRDGKPALTDETVGYVRADQVPHADPGEVERLIEQLEAANQAIAYAAQQLQEKQKVTDALMADAKQFRAERDNLRAQLAEAHALLADAQLSVCSDCGDAENPERAKHAVELADRIDVALSASAEPSAPVDRMAVIRKNAEDLSSRLKNACCQSCMSNPCDCAIQSAPVERDERAEFEADCLINGLDIDRLPSGEYLIPSVRFGWEGWQARAALKRKP